jgi:choloylglycine hydrolase
MRSRILSLALPVVALSVLGPIRTAPACTGIRIRAGDGAEIAARTMEFGADLHSRVVVLPRGASYVGTGPGGVAGLRWAMKYAAAGADAFNLPVIVDGLNEKGLGVGIFYFPGHARYQDVAPDQVGRALAPWELPTYLLGNCADAAEAVAALKGIRLAAVSQERLGAVPPCHYVVHDAAGHCVVIEPVDGELKVHDDPLGVVTNAPTFDWHVTNLNNYVNLSPNNTPPDVLSGLTFAGLGQGTGMLGLPGDFTPASRFVRAVALTQASPAPATAREGVLRAFHILNQFDIPLGSVRAREDGREVDETTLWTAASDLKNLRYYFHTRDSRRIRMVDLKAIDLDAGAVVASPMAGPESIEDVTGALRPSSP